MSSKKRSVAKTFTWRLFASSVTATLFFVMSGKLTLSLLIGGTESIIKLFGYYAHERIWDNIKWGKK